MSALNAGRNDVFVRKYNTSGNLVWAKQFGTNMGDNSHGASVDGLGNLYVSGKTFGTLSGSSGSGPQFVRKYTTDGTLLWTTQFGDSLGQFGRVSADSLGNVFAGDYAYVFKLDSTGAVLWQRNAPAYGVAADGLGNVYVTGSTWPDQAAMLAGNFDIFLAKLDSGGNFVWAKYIGGPTIDVASTITTDGQGSIYIAGHLNIPIGTTGNFHSDIFVSKFDAGGNQVWTRQMGTPSDDAIDGISVVGQSIYVSGQTFGSFGGPTAGGSDAFLMKIVDVTVPEPTSIALAGTCDFGLLLFSKQRQR